MQSLEKSPLLFLRASPYYMISYKHVVERKVNITLCKRRDYVLKIQEIFN